MSPISYGIIRIEKYHREDVLGIESHDKRKSEKGNNDKRKSEKGNNDKRKSEKGNNNKSINWSLTHKNYDIHFSGGLSFTKKINERIADLKLSKAPRKDAVVMSQAIITSDHEFFENLALPEQEKFFRDSYDFICNRYGKENIFSATVHLDEATPHMHVNFVPVTPDGRLSAKSLFNPVSLKNLQTDFFTDVSCYYGLERGEEGRNQKHLTVAEYKLKTAEEKEAKARAESKTVIERTNAEVTRAKRELGEINSEIKRKTEAWENKESQLKEKHSETINLLEQRHTETMNRHKSEEEKEKTKLVKIKNDYKTLQAENKKTVCEVNKVRAIQPTKNLMGIQNITLEQITWLKELAETLFLSQTQYRQVNEKITRYRTEHDEAVSELEEAEDRLREMSKEVHRLKPIEKAFQRLPAEQQEALLNPPKPPQRTAQRTVSKSKNRGYER